jgi:hypothetical protein
MKTFNALCAGIIAAGWTILLAVSALVFFL